MHNKNIKILKLSFEFGCFHSSYSERVLYYMPIQAKKLLDTKSGMIFHHWIRFSSSYRTFTCILICRKANRKASLK